MLSEGAASLLPGQDRPAVVWTIELGGSVNVERAIVRSRSQLDYETVQDLLLQRVGEQLEAEEAARGGVSLDLPQQEVVEEDGRFLLRNDTVLATEGWNEQLSLLAGRAAARIMLDGGIGLLRTMPPPDDRVLAHLRRLAKALTIAWPKDASYADVVRSVDRTSVRGVVFLQHAARAMRGASYAAFDGEPPSSSSTLQSRRRTRTSPHRCDDSRIATRTRWCSRCVPASRFPRGRGTHCRHCPRS